MTGWDHGSRFAVTTDVNPSRPSRSSIMEGCLVPCEAEDTAILSNSMSSGDFSIMSESEVFLIIGLVAVWVDFLSVSGLLFVACACCCMCVCACVCETLLADFQRGAHVVIKCS